MLAIYGRICKLTAGELREIDAGICQLCKDLRIVCNIFMERNNPASGRYPAEYRSFQLLLQ